MLPEEVYPIAAARCAAAMACPVPEAYGELLAWMSRLRKKSGKKKNYS